MTKRYMVVPPDAVIVELDGKRAKLQDGSFHRDISFAQFLTETMCDDTFGTPFVMGNGATGYRNDRATTLSMLAIMAAAKDKKPGETVIADEDDWQRLQRAVDTRDYRKILNLSLKEHMDAVASATTKPPAIAKHKVRK